MDPRTGTSALAASVMSEGSLHRILRPPVLVLSRLLLLMLGLLMPLNLPFSVPSVGEDKLFGWSSVASSDGSATHLVVTRTMRHAYTAGLLMGDVIVAANGEPADSAALARIRQAAAAGDTLELLVLRGERPVVVRIPVATNSLSYSGYFWYRLAIALAGWLVGMGLVTWRGSRPAALALGGALLLLIPITIPSGVHGEGALLGAARAGWQLQAAAHRFFFPALLLHFLILHTRRPAALRSPPLWATVYLGLFTTLVVVTDGLRDTLAWSQLGPERELRTAAGLLFELLTVAAALHLRRQAKELPIAVRWLSFAILMASSTTAILGILLLALGEPAVHEAFWRMNGLTLVLLPIAGAHYFSVPEESSRSDWHHRRRMASSVSAMLTGLYGLAVAGAAAVVLSSAGRSLDGIEWLLFAAIFAATIVFSPVLRWARETVDRRMFARWLELEARTHSFVDRLGTELEPERIAARITRELPTLLAVPAASLVLAREVAERWGVADSTGLALAPRERLEAQAALGHAEDRAAVVPIHGPEGELMGTLRLSARSDGRHFEPPEHGLLRTLALGVAAALRNAETYLQLRRAQEGLAEADRMAMMGALAGGLAHEIKNPLAGLKMGLHLLERDGVDRDRLQRFHRDVRRIDDLVSGLLRYTHEAGGEPHQPVELRQVARSCMADLHPQAEDRGAKLIEHGSSEEAIALGGPAQLRLIISNLLSNALDAVGDGGTVSVGVQTRAITVEVEISDSGPGIPPELRERIFDLNFSTKPGGTGLGLALARREAERLGGRIEVGAGGGQGTRLRVILPRAL